MADWLTHLSWMTRQSWPSPYPVHAGLGFFPSSRQTVPPRVIVNHSTETLDFPGYNRGAAAPHITGSLARHVARQHVPLSWGSRCLAVSAGGIRDLTVNTSGVIQIEWIGAVTPGYPKRYGHYDIPAIGQDDEAMRFVAQVWAEIARETGIPLTLSNYGTWVAYPGSYGARASQRLSSAQFRDARGLLGHQHVPANDHGDGLLGRAVKGRAPDMEHMLSLARDILGGVALPVPPPRDTDLRRGFTRAALDHAETMLDALGIPGADVWAKTRAYQTWAGLDPEDGLPGPQTTASLEETMSKIDDLTTVTIPPASWKVITGQDVDTAQTVSRDWVDSLVMRRVYEDLRNGRQIQATLTAQGKILEQLAAGQGIDPAVVREAVSASVREGLDDVAAEVRDALLAEGVADTVATRVVATLAERLTATPATTQED